MSKRIRKPAHLWTENKQVYANFETEGHGCIVYIGGPYGEDGHRQIHLQTKEQVLKLAAWLQKAAAYVSSKDSSGGKP